MQEKMKKITTVFLMGMILSLGCMSVNCYAASSTNAKQPSIKVNVSFVAETIAPSKEMTKEMYLEENYQQLANNQN